MDQALPIDPLLDTIDLPPDEPPPQAPPAPRRQLAQMMRKIPVTLTLEVGSARVSLDELSRIRADSVVPLDTLAGEPLTIKVNGTTIGRAEVVVTGDKYGLKVVEVSDLDLGLPEA
ncbi:flagellar motor switch protein FliN [Rubrivivax gelatinosus]|uniref:Flagellar motor switch protein FliN n=1 Tax=Rubrivivax gelatinosus TaxID=28068 RepID=A0ABS1DZ09_RUBGE|nr:FliM/FliN family flagellar motor switch protein [Rubrivivax gelatinosus]MBK1616111.1 flagellar motor switch protein FliN [Rubrivivax gelatinosus]MBK1715341.1 flagellar motor switch protein FliN [Rubrivivax gelatinosus]